jgi:tetratricopeptide (TPR) repeat protein
MRAGRLNHWVLGGFAMAAALAAGCRLGAAQDHATAGPPRWFFPFYGVSAPQPIDGPTAKQPRLRTLHVKVIRPFTSPEAAEAYNLAQGYANHGDQARAIEQYGRVIKLEPLDARPFIGRCIAYRHARDYEHAIRDCDEAIRLEPSSANAFLNRGVTRFLKPDLQAAVADFTEAIRIDPNYAEAYNDRAVAGFLLGHSRDEVISDLNQAVILDPASFDARFNRANAYVQGHQWELAIADYDKALSLKPDDPRTYNNRGVAYRGKGEHEHALADFRRALALSRSTAVRQAVEGNIADYARSARIMAPSVRDAEFGNLQSTAAAVQQQLQDALSNPAVRDWLLRNLPRKE